MTAVLDRLAVDADELRSAARQASTAAERYEAAARRLGDRTGGLRRHWRGTAAAAADTELAQLQSRARAAGDAYAAAADVLTSCARRLDEAQELQDRAASLRRRHEAELAAAAGRGHFVSPYAGLESPLLRQAERLDGEARQAADGAVARASHQLRELAERAPVGQPRGLSAADQVAGFFRGAVDTTWSSVVAAAELSTPRMLLDPDGWREQVRSVGDGVVHAAQHPGSAARSLVGWEALEQGRYGEWAGGFVPDIAGAVVSGGVLPATRRGAQLTDELSELAEDTADLQRVHDGRRVGLRPGAGGPVVPRPGAQMTPSYPDVIKDLAPERRTHILDGDPPHVNGGKGGGHRAGTGKGKSEFPPHWTDDDIIRRVMETARRPSRTEEQTSRRTLLAIAEHDGVVIQVVVDPDGAVVTAYPLSGSRVLRSNVRMGR